MTIPALPYRLILRSRLRTTALALTLIYALTLIAMQPAQAQTFTILHSFTGGSDGEYPYAGVAIDRGGHLYGTTTGGGILGDNCSSYNFGCGVAFELSQRNSNWIFTPLYSFQGGADGAIPYYPLHDFLGGSNDGEYPYGGVALDASGNLYGTTANGGVHNYGVVWQITP